VQSLHTTYSCDAVAHTLQLPRTMQDCQYTYEACYCFMCVARFKLTPRGPNNLVILGACGAKQHPHQVQLSQCGVST
jgi:hypothetical protein